MQKVSAEHGLIITKTRRDTTGQVTWLPVKRFHKPTNAEDTWCGLLLQWWSMGQYIVNWTGYTDVPTMTARKYSKSLFKGLTISSEPSESSICRLRRNVKRFTSFLLRCGGEREGVSWAVVNSSSFPSAQRGGEREVPPLQGWLSLSPFVELDLKLDMWLDWFLMWWLDSSAVTARQG